MYLDICNNQKNGKKNNRVLLRESYRENGKVKKRTIANLSHCSEKQIMAIEFSLKNHEAINKGTLVNLDQSVNGKIIGAVSALYQAAGDCNITEALGTHKEGRLSLAMIISRLINQGSRLACLRLAKNHALNEIIGLPIFTANQLYKAMDWLALNQESIEKKMFKKIVKSETIYLYDVSSTYLEGIKNELADYGYNRDKKQGKMQIVYGLLMTASGEPISIEVFKGNTKDTNTVKRQIDKLKSNYGCKNITGFLIKAC